VTPDARPAAARARRALPLLLLVVAGTAVAAVAGPDVPLSDDASFAVTAPADGAAVGDGFRLAWTSAGTDRYAVVVDDAVPAPGSRVEAGERVLLLTGTSLRLTLGDATTGSPSARAAHSITVVPLDAAGRRSGEDVAVVHVRGR
jgi:hypothetical protein